ncbi:trypsin 5G1-like [Ochlerotatus camptorhynchus]|uniref:trypsin 5G1-like n=1 Tax=Ochlerotatus camptorhynchus TaxID=644619 RepID=UPI0031CDDDB6
MISLYAILPTIIGIHLIGTTFAYLVQSDGRIIGGFLVDITEVPFQVALLKGDRHLCGGVIIDDRWILTAAHCVQPQPNVTLSGLKIRIASNFQAKGGEVIDVFTCRVHPKFDVRRADYDVALLKLEKKLNLTDAFYAVDLPKSLEPVEDGTCLQLSGWGLTMTELESREILRAVQIPAVNQDECRKAYKGFAFQITDRMLCAGYVDGQLAYQGDSGGPLVDERKLVGITSWGGKNAKYCRKARCAGVYARVAYVRKWIHAETGI